MQLHLECVEVSLYRVEVKITVWDRCVKCRVRVKGVRVSLGQKQN